jgi:RluA family pseudouridine synthase
VRAADQGRRLDEWAQEWLGEALGREVSRSEVRRWIMAGAVRMEGAPLRRPGLPVATGSHFEAALRPDSVRGFDRRPVRLRTADILFEDAWLVAVSKPPGIPTHETVDPRRPHLVGLLTALLSFRTAGGSGDRVRLGIHQRLDRDTSGVILFTKDRAVDAALARQFAERGIVKTYHALTTRPPHAPAREWRVRGDISPKPGVVQKAETDFRLVESLPGGLLVEARPRTGRKHQIRVQLAEGGLPILGDERYGRGHAAGPPVPRLMLHAFRLELRHPWTDRPLAIESPWPADFRNVIDRLRAEPSARPAPGRRMSRR